jgi:hypothetical protein
LSTNRRTFIATGAVAAATIAAGGTWWALRGDDDPKGASSRIDLLAGVYAGPPHEAMPEHFALLSLTGGTAKNTEMELRFHDLEATPMPVPDGLTATLANLITGEKTEEFTINSDGGVVTLEQDAISSDGWWQLRMGAGDPAANWTFLVPDPNLTGLDTPQGPDTDPDAQALLEATLDNLTQRTSMRWWEWLSGGNGSIILARFSITTPESNGLPPSFESNSLLAGRIPQDGTAASFRQDNPRSVTIGDEAWRYTDAATPESIIPVQYLPIDQYDTTYAGHEQVQFGMTADIDGRACQLVSFYLPGAIPAWFAFWIEVESASLRELFMLSVNHYMHWVYHDIDESFELAF